jgi:hypothetical protein
MNSEETTSHPAAARDYTRCVVKQIATTVFECLETDGRICPHHFYFGYSVFCNHPTRAPRPPPDLPPEQ